MSNAVAVSPSVTTHTAAPPAAHSFLSHAKLIGFLTLVNLNPGLTTPMYTHLNDDLGLDESFVGLTDAVGSIGMASAPSSSSSP